MALLTWSKDYSVGVQSIDGQHLSLFNMLNELHAAMMKGQARSVAGPVLRRLVNYTREHFEAEEAMMASAKYPGLADHRIKHRELTRQAEEFMDRFERGEATINIQLLNFLRDWLSIHIKKSDKEYTPWMQKAGQN